MPSKPKSIPASSTALALPETAPACPVKPKPTRREIIAAMVEIAREQHGKEIAEIRQKIAAIDTARRQRAIALVRKNLKSLLESAEVAESYRGLGYIRVSLMLDPDEESKAAETERTRLQRSQSPFDEAEVKRQILHKFAMSQECRVQQLLNDPTSRQHLTEALAAS